MEIREIRRKNLEVLEGNYENKERFAEALNITGSYLYQLQTGIRPISEKTARKFETLLRLPHNWFDQEINDTQKNKVTEQSSTYSKGLYIYSKQDIDLINNFNLLMPEQQSQFFSAIEQTVEKNEQDFRRLKQIYGGNHDKQPT